jgi:hypothetical protein
MDLNQSRKAHPSSGLLLFRVELATSTYPVELDASTRSRVVSLHWSYGFHLMPLQKRLGLPLASLGRMLQYRKSTRHSHSNTFLAEAVRLVVEDGGWALVPWGPDETEKLKSLVWEWL